MTAAWPTDTPLGRLLALVGPADAAMLLLQLKSDLSTASNALSLAVGQDDSAAARFACHDLVALCGTVGDVHLHALSQQLRRQLDDVSTMSSEIRVSAIHLVTEVERLCRKLSHIMERK